jgi:hypothetical protein
MLGALHLRVLDPYSSIALAHALGTACRSGAGLLAVGCTNVLSRLNKLTSSASLPSLGRGPNAVKLNSADALPIELVGE